MKIQQKRMITIILMFLLTFLNADSAISNNKTKIIKSVFNNFSGKYLIYVSKKDFTLSIFDRNIKSIAAFKIGYGLNPDKKPKLYSGDKRTPEGVYKIVEILSLDAGKNTNAFKKLKKMNDVYFKAKDGHYKFGRMNVDLGKGAYGPRFFRLDYPNANDRLRYSQAKAQKSIPISNGDMRSIGSGIAIHGNNDSASIGQLSSSGCVRMNNTDIVKLEKFAQLHTPVIISMD